MIAQGTKIVYTADKLGCWYSDHIVNKGDVGIYLYPHKVEELARKGWHMTAVESNGVTHYAPVHSSMFDIEER